MFELFLPEKAKLSLKILPSLKQNWLLESTVNPYIGLALVIY